MTSPARVVATLSQLRAKLVERYGWTHLEVTAQIDRSTRSAALRGEVLVDRLVQTVADAVRRDLPAGWHVDVSGVTVMAGGAWWRLAPGVHRLYARHDADTTGWGAFVEVLGGEVVQQLATVDAMTLVRGRDGTVGWMHDGLEAPDHARPLVGPQREDLEPFVAVARACMGVPYRLGGATREGIDCSALVQQAAAALGVIVPRHSSDQLQVDPRDGPGHLRAGDLAFVWNAREALCHVGVATGTSIIHASRSRGRVVEDRTEVFERDAQRQMHVPFESLLDFARRVAGHPSLTAAGFALGRRVGKR